MHKMGYITFYELRVENAQEFPKEELAKASAALRRAVLGEEDDDDPFNWVSYDWMEWHTHKTDMLALSTQFPDMLFCLYGDGEESTNFWREFFKNGKSCCQPARICYDPPPIWAEV